MSRIDFLSVNNGTGTSATGEVSKPTSPPEADNKKVNQSDDSNTDKNTGGADAA